MNDAIAAKKPAIVITITSRFWTWVSSWAMTPSSSDGVSSWRIPVVAHTVAVFGERPIANAFGIAVCAIATRGFGRFAWMHSRSISAWNCGASCGLTTCAPIEYRAILSEVKNWTRNRAPAITAIVTAPAPGGEQHADQHRVHEPQQEEGEQHPKLEAGIASE